MEKSKALFEITEEDAQFSAEHRIGRKLTCDEINIVERYLKYAFEDWGIILKKAVLKAADEKGILNN